MKYSDFHLKGPEIGGNILGQGVLPIFVPNDLVVNGYRKASVDNECRKSSIYNHVASLRTRDWSHRTGIKGLQQ